MYKEINIPAVEQPQTLGFIQFLIIPAGVFAYKYFKKKGKKDAWSSMSWSEKEEYVRAALKQAILNYVQGDVVSVENYLKQAIAQVEHDESWGLWKSRNTYYVQLMNEATKEANALLNIINDISKGKDVTFRLNHFYSKFLSRNEVSQLIGSYQPANGGTDNKNQITGQSAAFGYGVFDWIKNNPLPSALIAGTLFLSGLLFFNSNNNNDLVSKQLT